MIKNLPATVEDTGDAGLISGSGKSPGEGNGNPLQYCCLENSMDSGDWQAAVHEVSRVGHDLVTEHTRACEVTSMVLGPLSTGFPLLSFV